MNNITIYQRRLGEIGRAEATGTATLDGLTASLGDSHLLTLGCAINVANVLADADRHEEAENLYRQTSARLHTVLDVPENSFGRNHPDLLACQANLAVALHEMGRDEEARQERAKTLTALTEARGRAHPDTIALAGWHRIDRELD